jgi:hypothetical protein
LLAGGFAVIDQELEMHQRQDLGFVNPMLYTLGRSTLRGQAFADVVNYGNDIGPFIPNARRPLGCCSAGAGYDKASGWGSVNLANFAGEALFLAPPKIRLSVPGQQHPLRRHRLLATVACAAACRVAAFAEVRIGHARPFEADSHINGLATAGAKTIAVRFSAKELRRIRQGLNRHQNVVATLYAVVITGRRTVEFRTGGIRVRIER